MPPSLRNLLALALLLATSALVLLQEPFAPFANGNAAYDTGVYLYAARRILDGALIYRDVFDHKGPLLHLLNTLGLAAGNGSAVGIWLVEVACLFAAATLMFRTAQRLTGRFSALLAVLFTLVALATLEPGSGAQFYALPLMAVALDLFVAQLVSEEPLSWRGLAALGASFTLTILLQPNLASIWCVFGAVAAWRLAARRRYRELARNLVIAALAALATLLPFLAYALRHGILAEVVSCYWTFNRQYAHPTVATLALGIKYTIANLERGNAVIPFFVYLGLLVTRRGGLRHPALHLATAGSALLTLVIACALSGRNYPHYAIALLPLLCIALASLFEATAGRGEGAKWLLAVVVLAFSLEPAAWHFRACYLSYRPEPRSAALVDFIKEHSEPADSIAVIGNDSQLYYRSGRRSSSRYHYTNPIFEVPGMGTAMAEEFSRELLAGRPKLIIIKNDDYPAPPAFVAEILERDYARVPFADSAVSVYTIGRSPS